MEPMSDYTDFLFPYLTPDQINRFSCDHIIPDESLKTIPVGSYEQQPLDFLFKNRLNPQLIRSLGNCLVEIVKRVPDGVVVFFPSYKYLDHLVDQWRNLHIFNKLKSLKGGLFVESKNNSEQVDVLRDYTDTVKSGSGGLLFSVVGGKLSEGINFLDELARAVIMVGLPYPNVMSSELIAKRKFIHDKTLARTSSKQIAQEISNQFIENICMRSVNQSIGRSIRHINDYSMIYLLDGRYQQTRIQNKLSGWIRQRILNDLPFNDIMNHTDEFFVSKSIKVLT
jgi:chromosome transmission fidelity protein 1